MSDTAMVGPIAGPHPVMRILGVPVHQIDMNDTVSTILRWIGAGESQYVCIRDVHGIMQAQRSTDLQNIHETAGLVTPDGMPLVWISRLRGSKTIARVCGADLVDALCDASKDGGISHFFYGGKPGIAEQMAETLRVKYPNLRVAGTHTPPFRELTADEDAEVVDKIRASGAKIVWLGVSTPKQELWMRDHVQRLPGVTVIGVGAAFDFHAGVVRRAPRWMQKYGLEWSHRLASEPRRLWYRYLVLAPLFVVKLLYSSLIDGEQRRE